MRTIEREKARAFLESAREARMEIARHRARAADLECRCTRVTSSPSATRGGGGDTQALWAALADARDRARLAERRETEAYDSVERFINHLPNPTHRAVLRLRYLRGMSWVRVQLTLRENGTHYSESHIKRLHSQALTAAEELWEEENPGGAAG